MCITATHKPEFYPLSFSKAMHDDYKKKYFLFSGSFFFTSKAWDDFRGSFYTLDEALDFLEKNIDPIDKQWYQVIDIESEKIVKEDEIDETY